jgi:tetratricopeptide (TPR) repeat protein
MSAPDNYYNLLVQGFRVGQLDPKREVPSALAQLADPYDPSAYASYGQEVGDMSYYKGKLYLYFGVTPAVMLFWPCVALTSHYLLQKDAVVILCLVGFLTSVGLLGALWRRYFAEVNWAVVAAGGLALGLASGMPVMLTRCDVYEVPISCGYAFTMLALAAIWKALHETERRCWWLASASLAYGLAVAARPSLLFGAVILLVPVVKAWRERGDVAVRKRGPPKASVAAAVVPIALIGLGLMLYNASRFDNPFEFGWHHVLSGGPRRRLFNVRYLWFNFRMYFLALGGWSGRFPFVQQIAVPRLPEGYDTIESPYGVLINIPIVWLALAVPLVWRGWSGQVSPVLRWLVATVTLLLGMCVLPLVLYATATVRFEVDFLPALVLLAVIGILALEQAMAPTTESGQAERTIWRHAVRSGWGVLLVFSVAFNLLACVERCALWHDDLAIILARQGRLQEAIDHYEQALRLKPDFALAQYNLGNALLQARKLPEAIGHYERALHLKPDFAGAQLNLGDAMQQSGRIQEAISQYEQALRIQPDLAEAHCNLGVVLQNAGQVQEAIGQYEQALRIQPDYAHAHNELGTALMRQGRLQEAIGHYEQAVRIQPTYAEAHYNLGKALLQAGKVPDAIEHCQQAVRLKPEFAEAHSNLGVALQEAGQLQRAISHYEQALRIKPDLAEAQLNLGIALEQLGRVQEAINHYEQALRIKPDFVEAQNALARARAAP